MRATIGAGRTASHAQPPSRTGTDATTTPLQPRADTGKHRDDASMVTCKGSSLCAQTRPRTKAVENRRAYRRGQWMETSQAPTRANRWPTDSRKCATVAMSAQVMGLMGPPAHTGALRPVRALRALAVPDSAWLAASGHTPMPLQIARPSAGAKQLYADFEPDALATAHRRGIGTNVSRRAATEERKSAADLEPEGGFEPPTCRLRGHRRPVTVSKADKVAQLRRAERQGRSDSVKGGTLAETLAEQGKQGAEERLIVRLPCSRNAEMGALLRVAVWLSARRRSS
jgi:hypothetical protein